MFRQNAPTGSAQSKGPLTVTSLLAAGHRGPEQGLDFKEPMEKTTMD